jgi:hypothetical protein
VPYPISLICVFEKLNPTVMNRQTKTTANKIITNEAKRVADGKEEVTNRKDIAANGTERTVNDAKVSSLCWDI